MSVKAKTVYVCQQCGSQSARWEGRCSHCGAWNSFVEERLATSQAGRKTRLVEPQSPVLLRHVEKKTEERFSIGIKEMDRVLGGGIVPGSVVLVGGDPGIGKSTLMLQAMARLSAQGRKVLYVTGEESAEQTKMRADRLDAHDLDSLYIVTEIDVEAVASHIQAVNPDVVVMDSVQVLVHPDIPSSPGSVAQVRECASLLTQLAKQQSIALFLIGHVTKEGMIAGPRVLEHIVDTVLYFEGERYTAYRIIRSMKNRFGATHELGVFEMTGGGLKEVSNPSELFLSQRPENSSGSVVVPIMEGSRSFLVEVQGLVARSSFGMARQKAQGFDNNRLALLIAVLEKRFDLDLLDKDVFLNIVGGVKVSDPAADLGVAMAIASALLERILPYDTVFCGEIGLSGEVRSVSQILVRIKEAQKLGFKRCVIPEVNARHLGDGVPKGIEIISVKTLREALDHFS